MFINKRSRKGKEFKYIEHSYRLGNKVRKISIYLPKKRHFTVDDFEKENQHLIKKIAEERMEYYRCHRKTDSFFQIKDVLYKIEQIRISFQFLFSRLKPNERDEAMNEYLRTFFVNSLEMEGGTISYDVAKEIDAGKLRKKPVDVTEADIVLYKNIHKAERYLRKTNIRSAKDIIKLHGIIYNRIYDFAGNIRGTNVTFGVAEDAITSSPDSIRHSLLDAIMKYRRNKKEIYPFEGILRFHVDYQRVHPFRDGNSRLGRLLLSHELLNNGYPPPILKKSNSQGYRSSLVRAINHGNYTSFFKLYYNAYKRTWIRFFKPLLEEKMRRK